MESLAVALFPVLRRVLILCVTVPLLAGADSRLDLPIRLPLPDLIQQAEDSIPKRYDSAWQPASQQALGVRLEMPVAVRYQVERRPIDPEGRGDVLRLRMPVLYRVQLGVPALLGGWKTIAQCRPQEGALLRIETQIAVSDAWALTPRSRTGIEALAPCRLAALRERIAIDVTPQVRRGFEDALRDAGRQLDNEILRRAALITWGRQLWDAVKQSPIPGLTVERLGLFPPRFEGDRIVTGLRVETGREAVMADEPRFERLSGPASFHLDLNLDLAPERASEWLGNTLAGKEIRGSGKKVRIEQARLACRDGRLWLDTRVSGGFRGEVRLRGIPKIDRSTLFLDQLEYAIETDNVLVRFASWMRHESYRRDFAKLARIDLAAWFQEQRGELARNLSKLAPVDMEIEGQLAQIESGGIEAQAERLRVHAVIGGDIRLVVRPQAR